MNHRRCWYFTSYCYLSQSKQNLASNTKPAKKSNTHSQKELKKNFLFILSFSKKKKNFLFIYYRPLVSCLNCGLFKILNQIIISMICRQLCTVAAKQIKMFIFQKCWNVTKKIFKKNWKCKRKHQWIIN